MTKKIMDKIYDETISEENALTKAFLVGCLEGIVDGCLIVGAIQVVRGTIRLITRK